MGWALIPILVVFVSTLVGAMAAPLVSIKVLPRVVMAGGAMRITCKVPRRAENRKLAAGIANYTSTERQLDGEESRITWEFLFDHMPCGVGPAFCAVSGTDRDQLATQPIEIAGCEP